MKKWIWYLVIGVCFASCDFFWEREEYNLTLENNTTYPIGYYLAGGDTLKSAYPDTSLPLNNVLRENRIYPEKKQVVVVTLDWDKFFDKYLPNDTLSVFIFHADTLNKYTWEEIRDGYKIENRYDLSLDDLKKMNFVITYP